MFRSCFIDPFQGMVMAKFSRETLKKARAAVLFDASNDYSKGTAEVFRDGFRKMAVRCLPSKHTGRTTSIFRLS